MSYLDELFNLRGKVVAAWGGTGALVSTMAKGLCAAGCTVIILGRNQERGNQVVAKCDAAGRSSGGVAEFLQTDVSDLDQVIGARQHIYRTHGRVDVLLNGAGGNNPAATVGPDNPFCGIEEAEMQVVMDLNYTHGTIHTCQVFGERMLTQSGTSNIINITSASAHIPLSKVVAYSAAKAACLSLTLFLAREWAEQDIRVNAISPGFFPAEQNMGLLYIDSDPQKGLTERGDQIIGHTPVGRVGKAEELIAATLLLASDAASPFTTGHEMIVDGCFTNKPDHNYKRNNSPRLNENAVFFLAEVA